MNLACEVNQNMHVATNNTELPYYIAVCLAGKCSPTVNVLYTNMMTFGARAFICIAM